MLARLLVVNPVRIVLSPRRTAERLLDVLVPAAVAAVLRRIDLTALVLTHIDLEKVLATVDLPALVRESASDSVHRARLRAIAADDAVGRLRARLLPRPESRSRPR